MRSFNKVIFVMLAAFGFSACSSKTSESGSEYRKISAQEAKQMIDSDKSIIILDVRTKEEFRQGYIKNALMITDSELKEKAPSALPDKNAKILVYCRSGRRSKTSAKLLISMGYKNVYDFGGIIDWPYETVK